MPAALPGAFGRYFDGLEEQLVATRPGDLFFDCFGCGRHHPAGLRVRSFKRAGEVVAPIVIAAEHAGPPGAAHGGIVASYLDEVLGHAVFADVGRPGLTGELTVRYLRPVPTETPLLVRARTTARQAKYVDVEGAVEDFQNRVVLATARGRFFPR